MGNKAAEDIRERQRARFPVTLRDSEAHSQEKGWTWMERQPDDASRRVTLSKAQRATSAGGELIALLTELSDDGVVTRAEVARLRAWLEVDRGVDFAACGFLYEVVESITSDGEITEAELDTLALAIERVLPPDIRRLAL